MKLLQRIFIFILLVGVLYGQEFEDVFDSTKIIEIILVGNNHTKRDVILREMKSKIGDTLNAKLLFEDQKRLLNTQLFTRVEIQPVPSENGTVLIVIVAERWYLFPYPFVYRNERDWKKLSYGAGLLHQNFRGRNTVVDGSVWFGYNPGVKFYYSNPWFGGRAKLFSDIKIYARKMRSQSLEFERFYEVQRGISVSIGKRWGYHTFFSLLCGYQSLKVPSEYTAVTASKTTVDRLPSLGFDFRYDTRDLHQYPKKGWYLQSYAVKTTDLESIDFIRYGFDFRRYQPVIKEVSIGVRAAVDLAGGGIPVYSRKFLGYTERIRGYFNTRMEGDNRFLASAEMRFPLLPIQYIDLDTNSDLLGAYSSNLPFGISGAVFYDTGTVWKKDYNLSVKDLYSGFGLGIHIHLPYVDIFRLECAMNDNNETEFIIDLGVWF